MVAAARGDTLELADKLVLVMERLELVGLLVGVVGTEQTQNKLSVAAVLAFSVKEQAEELLQVLRNIKVKLVQGEQTL